MYYVTASQLVEWMKNPVPVSQVADTLTCRIVDLKPPGEYKQAQQQQWQRGAMSSVVHPSTTLLP